MYALIAPFRPIGKGNALTYSLDNTAHGEIQKGDIIEIPLRQSRARGVVLDIFKKAPEYETKAAGKILVTNFFSTKFLQFLSATAEENFSEISHFLPFSIPAKTHEMQYFPPVEKFWRLDSQADISDIKGKKQLEVLEYFKKNTTALKQNFSTLKITSSVIQRLEEKKILYSSSREKFFYSPESYILPASKGVKKIKTLDLHPEKNIFLGSNFSAKNIEIIEWIQNITSKKKQVLFLFPDKISLLQMEEKFSKIFPEKFFQTLHSGISPNEQSQIFWKIFSGHIPLLLANKNALFLPFKNLGGIIMHQYADNNYQAFSRPYFFAPDIAKIRCQEENIPLLFSSTTGDISEIYNAQHTKNGKIFSFPPLQTPQIRLVDMNAERANNNHSIFSLELQDAITQALQGKEQVLLFLNRRGVHTSLHCQDCGDSPISPLSGQRMGIFKSPAGKKILQCPSSGYNIPFPKTCSKCGKNNFFEQGIGTQKGEEEIQKKFPTAHIIRIDSDTVKSTKNTREILDNISENTIDIIIGTKMALRAFAFENVSVVASLLAENDFLFPSFSAEEQGFAQAMNILDAGGKKFSAPKIFLQTNIPAHPLFEKIITQNFPAFYQQEITNRKILQFPPFTQSITLLKQGKTKAPLEKKFAKIFSLLNPQVSKIFPPKISYHPARKIFLAEVTFFHADAQKIIHNPKNQEELKNITVQRNKER